MIRQFFRAASLGILLLALPAKADEKRLAEIKTIHQFYGGLSVAAVAGQEDAKAEAIRRLLSPMARIDLTDLDIVQTADELISSLTELDDALAGTRITHRIGARDSAAVIRVLVCYEFETNFVLNQEVVTFDNNLISLITQTPIADNCAAL